MADFSQQPGEATAEWLARLQAVGLGGLSGAERRSLLEAEQAARGQAGRERRDAGAEAARQTALGQARAAYLMLAPTERQQFILWLAQGAPEGVSAEAEGGSRPGG
jgi:hypothetical protein